MATLPTNFKDDILDTSVNARRRYRVYENTDGTIELEDVTEYSQVGDAFGAGQINSTNTEVNKKFDKIMLVRDLDTISAITKEGYAPDALAIKEVNDSLTAENSLKFQFATDGEGNYGYLGADDSFIPFKSGAKSMFAGLFWSSKECFYINDNNVPVYSGWDATQTTEYFKINHASNGNYSVSANKSGKYRRYIFSSNNSLGSITDVNCQVGTVIVDTSSYGSDNRLRIIIITPL